MLPAFAFGPGNPGRYPQGVVPRLGDYYIEHWYNHPSLRFVNSTLSFLRFPLTMGFGILQPDQGGLSETPPGTVLLEELHQPSSSHHETAQSSVDSFGLKHGTGNLSHVILVPQPTDDPNDPLNWPKSKKVLSTMIIFYGAILYATAISPLLNSSLAVIAMDLNRDIGDITLLSGYQLLVAGAMGPFIFTLSRKLGKRPVMVASSVLGLVGTIIGSTTTTFDGLLAARIIQGFSVPAYESLIFPMMSDMFFLHERGFWTAMANFILIGMSNFTSVITGAITDKLDWPYLFHILNAAIGLQVILLILFVPETSYPHRDRPTILLHRTAGVDNSLPEKRGGATSGDVGVSTPRSDAKEAANLPSPQRQKKTFWQELTLWNPEHQSQERVVKLFVAPFLACTNIGALWVIMVSGVSMSFFVAIAFTAAQIFSVPPYALSTAGIGYLSLGPTIGGLLASLGIACITDPTILWASKRNGGIFEPEFRLFPSILGVTAGAGLFGYGAVTQDQGNLYLAAFMWAMNLFGVAVMTGTSTMYAVDCFRPMSSEIFIASMMVKNFLFYGYSYFINDWVAERGPRLPFFVFGGISLFILLTTIPMYLFGKKYRSYWNRHNVMEKLNIATHED